MLHAGLLYPTTFLPFAFRAGSAAICAVRQPRLQSGLVEFIKINRGRYTLGIPNNI